LKTIFVGNLSEDVTSEKLHILFESYGEILGIDLAAGQDFGYVRMADDSDAYRAVTALNGLLCGGRMLIITVAKAYSSRKHRIAEVKEPGVPALK
jgi:RNA recognition motif-containing protein